MIVLPFLLEIITMENKNDNQINIELPEEVAEGTYSNLAIITHSQSEFIVDFIQVMPGMPKGKVKSRVVMTPQNAKRLMLALNDNIKKFEQAHGEVSLGDGNPMIPPINFGGTNNQA
ncbi:DUF3467 domain-containing protein [Wandonia haliotis]|uniref:DUF3467 domain-containing protein n=2 Tax=Wandonia haliotis TaxID=574963 RepID=A0ABN1MN35_9FLAO